MSKVKELKEKPVIIFELPIFKKTTEEKVFKMIPRELKDSVSELKIEKGKVTISFFLNVFIRPIFDTNKEECQLRRYIDIGSYDFQETIYPFFRKMLGNDDTKTINGCIRLNHLTGLSVMSKKPSTRISEPEMSYLAADKFSRFFEFNKFHEHRVEKEWNSFVESVEKLGGIKIDVDVD